MALPRVMILMGSESDRPVMQKAVDVLQSFGVSCACKALSAHRLPEQVGAFAREAEAQGVEVLIGAAGMAAHLAGALAAHSILPVIGVPVSNGSLNGLDALLATVQMPPGIPVATVAIDGAKNAGYLAVQILARKDAKLAEQLKAERKANQAKLLAQFNAQ